MKNTKTLIILCLILFLTAIGCSDYMEFAEREYQAEREYRATEDTLEENYEDNFKNIGGFKSPERPG